MAALDDAGTTVGHIAVPSNTNPDDDWIETQAPSDAGRLRTDYKVNNI